MSDTALRLSGVTKAFTGHTAVANLSLAIPRGSVFGLLGPNGAGKTTTLRMVMNILGPDSGTIEILDRPSDHSSRDRIGYMPEERGLYPRMVLEEQLLFMAEIKGTDKREAARRMGPWLERLGLADWRKKKVNELSKGMQQKAQFIATVLHEPEILILDEPMSGLDPVGMDMMREVLLDLKRQGKTLVLSSHQMETVERLCDRVALIHKGQKLLDGSVAEVKRQHGKNTLVLSYDGDGASSRACRVWQSSATSAATWRSRWRTGPIRKSILKEAAARLRLSRFEIVEPSLHDIFVENVKGEKVEAA